jgi:hypothetical protein
MWLSSKPSPFGLARSTERLVPDQPWPVVVQRACGFLIGHDIIGPACRRGGGTVHPQQAAGDVFQAGETA